MYFYVFLLFIFTFFIFIFINNNFLWESRKFIYKCDLKEDIDGLKIVHLSDLHDKSFFFFGQNILVEKIRNINPNIIVFTGDLIDNNKNKNKELTIDTIKELSLIAPLYYVLGNHEININPFKENAFLEKLRSIGVIILNDTYSVFDFNNSKIIINGLIDQTIINRYILYGRKGLKERAINLIKEEKGDLNILLYHKPNHIELFKKLDIDIIFAGHAHGGQIRIPFFRGLYVPNQGFLPKYTSGILNLEKDFSGQHEGVFLCISRGLGNSRCPIRIFNLPEIKTIIIKKKRS